MEPAEFDVFEILGLAGVGVYLGSYAALQSGLLRGSGYAYAFANLVASGLVLTSLASPSTCPPLSFRLPGSSFPSRVFSAYYYVRNSMKLSTRERLLMEYFPA